MKFFLDMQLYLSYIANDQKRQTHRKLGTESHGPQDDKMRGSRVTWKGDPVFFRYFYLGDIGKSTDGQETTGGLTYNPVRPEKPNPSWGGDGKPRASREQDER